MFSSSVSDTDVLLKLVLPKTCQCFNANQLLTKEAETTLLLPNKVPFAGAPRSIDSKPADVWVPSKDSQMS